MEEQLDHDLVLNASKLIMPTLFVVGSEDTNCPAKHIKILKDAMPEGEKVMEVLKGAPHSYYEKSEQEDCKNAIKKWLNKVLQNT